MGCPLHPLKMVVPVFYLWSMHVIIFVNNAMSQAHGFAWYKTMCLSHGIVDKDFEMHTPSQSTGTTLKMLMTFHTVTLPAAKHFMKNWPYSTGLIMAEFTGQVPRMKNAIFFQFWMGWLVPMHMTDFLVWYLIWQLTKNSGHLWLAYTELQGGFNMLQLIPIDSGHFTQPELWL